VNLREAIHESEPCIFVQGPSWDVTTGPLRRLRTRREGETFSTWAEPEFYGKWLLAAAKADDVWQSVIEEPRYKKQLECIPSGYFPAFGPTAIWLVSQLPSNSFSAIVTLNGKEDELPRWFLTARHLSFFAFTATHYEMRIPHYVGMGGVKNAVLAGFQMDERDCYLRPEYESPTMPYAEAKALQERVHEMRKNYRRQESEMYRLH
jgi:hypothetical protein